jgi:hypothetical protein
MRRLSPLSPDVARNEVYLCIIQVIPISGVKLYTECESSIDLTGFSLRLFRMTLTSLLVRLKSEHVDRLEMCKSPLTTRVRRYLTVSCFSATLRECCNCAAF